MLFGLNAGHKLLPPRPTKFLPGNPTPMYHDENPSNINRSFPLMGALTDYPYGETYTPLKDSFSAIDPASGYLWGFQQAENWMTAPAPSTITQSRRPNFRYREIRPRPPHIPVPTVTPNEAHTEEQHIQLRELGQGIHSKRQRQSDHEQVQRTTKKARPAVCEAAETTDQPVIIGKMSTAKKPPAPRYGSATQGPSSRSPDQPADQQEGTAKCPAQAVQEALKVQVLQSIKVLREIARSFRALNLELETIDGWISEIKGADATLIPVPSSTLAQIIVPFESLNLILTEYLTASGPMRGFLISDQALELLKYIQTYAEEYHLFQNTRVYFEIGRWIERLSPGNHDEQGE
ncbi:unnamed protein product [Penicillium salamii]|uniref:Uncharacterized protein n=1 Tax=Penicillium salamii TaxID=1612424 RepID=A0A9W4NW81_9EURO|nr:unnamed protein product [Penicillium salamii]CAG7951629.1 unnamed protein product [Penicillium salamii]CAG7957054.1 unnamed protein product [Penicillium salamii]CAG8226514.1 unnamed protein product [Penicillium salamii]CAG8295158.1 unnamed protein product [Penicillium salamii]